MTTERNLHDISVSLEEEKEVKLFDELIRLPKANRHRLLKAVKVYELVESHPELFAEKFRGANPH